MKTFPFMVLGNKSDLEDERKVKESKIESWLEDNGGHKYYETSAKEGDNVDKAFRKITELAAKNIKEEDL